MPCRGVSRRRRALAERLEDLVPEVDRDAGAVVLDRDEGAAVLTPDSDPDRDVRLGVAHGVHHQVLDDAFDLGRIHRNDDGLGPHQDRPIAENVEALHRPADDRGDVGGPDLRRDDPSRQAVDVEQVFGSRSSLRALSQPTQEVFLIGHRQRCCSA